MTVAWRRSLRWRLLGATLLALGVALGLAGGLMSRLFHEHVSTQFAQALAAQLDQLTARLAVDAEGRPRVDESTLTDPRWTRPLSGLYWQLDRTGPPAQRGVLRSRSLWDDRLEPPADALADGELHRHRVPGPDGQTLLLVERTVSVAGAPPGGWRVMVAADTADTQAARQRFDRLLALWLGALALLLMAAAWVQVRVGLAPLRALQAALQQLHEGRAARLRGPLPAEVQPLVDGFNRVLDRNDEVVARARTQAGNLAHAMKAPLAALAQGAAAARRAGAAPDALALLVDEQVALARRQVDWHLARARAAASQGRPGLRTPVKHTVDGLVRVMQRVHADRALAIDTGPIDAALHFAGESQDLQEMLGNLLDNACKWARTRVRVDAATGPCTDSDPGSGTGLLLTVEDDGPGIDPGRCEAVLQRGRRLDESVPGSGLGLAIVSELAGLYGGSLALGPATGGGLRARLALPGG